jgi:hypothetical protein
MAAPGFEIEPPPRIGGFTAEARQHGGQRHAREGRGGCARLGLKGMLNGIPSEVLLGGLPCVF